MGPATAGCATLATCNGATAHWCFCERQVLLELKIVLGEEVLLGLAVIVEGAFVVLVKLLPGDVVDVNSG